ncbi:MAG: alpha-galactosidase [Bacteroidaceae bacterium]|nr:alpha-galactosidase [Bacteroidaceae bacterium]
MKKAIIIIVTLLCPLSTMAQGRVQLNGRAVQAERWITEHFGRGQTPPFSFEYGGVPSARLIRRWKHTLVKQPAAGDCQVRYLATWTDPASGLRAECDVTGWTDYGAVEWVLRFENTGAANSQRVSRVRTVDVTFRHADATPVVYYANGSDASRQDFAPLQKALEPGDTLVMTPRGGRSSDGAFPFFNIQTSAGEGVVAAVGWSGTWTAMLTAADNRSLGMQAGLQTLDAILRPGEKIRTASICLLFWNGADRMTGNNRFRRYMIAHHSRHIDGKPVFYPMFGGFNWGDPAPCNEYTCMTTEYAVALMQRTKLFGLSPEAFWLDAGWYTEAADYATGRNWANTVGNWQPDPERFPQGLGPIGDYAKQKVGARFMVWFEPERVFKGTRWYREHPQWMLDAGGDNCLFNLADEEACRWMSKEIGDILEQNSIDHYRQDFNIAPAGIWAANDEPDRTGITEVKYITGLYAFWDYLLDRFPRLLIDNCASGGRRIDYETMLRSAPMWRTDYQYGEPVGYQCHTYGLEFFLAQHATGLYHTNPFDARSAFGSAVVFNWKLTQQGEAFTDMQKTMQEFREVRPYYYEDFYPLSGTGDLTGDDVWLAYQLHRPADQTGYILAFRRAQSPQADYTVKLSGLQSDAEYVVESRDGQNVVQLRDGQNVVESRDGQNVAQSRDGADPRTCTGKQMMEGITLHLEQPRSSALIYYSRK